MGNVKLFFDESGTAKKDTVRMMGGLMIPNTVYEQPDFIELNKELRENEYTLHWTDFGGGKKEAEIYMKVVKTFSKYSELCEFNIIRYDYPKNIDYQKITQMFYSKLPERVLYGLLRSQKDDKPIEADIFVERANMYESINLHETLKYEMNRQALYRGTNFSITNFSYKRKNEEIGVEITDIILGIVRNIIENRSNSNRFRRKNQLICEFMKIEAFKKFISSIKFFEWNYSYHLSQVDFSNYVKTFLSNQETWVIHLSKEEAKCMTPTKTHYSIRNQRYHKKKRLN